MSSSILPLRPSLHKTHAFSKIKDLSFTKNYSFSPVLIDEMTSLLPSYPLAFARVKEGLFTLVALHGIYNEENLFLNEENRWISNYIPNVYKAYPFVLVDNTLCFNMESGLYKEVPNEDEGDLRFFDDEGNTQEIIQKVLASLAKHNKYRQLTFDAVKSIVDADILTPWILSAENTNPEKQFIQGLYRIDEQKLKALSGEKLEKLNKAHALSIAYAQLLSIPRVEVLKQLHKMKESKQQAEIDINEFFGEGSNDTISFDF